MKRNSDKAVKKATKKTKKTKRETLPTDFEMVQPSKTFEKMEVNDRPYKEIYFDDYAEKEGGDQKYGIKRNRDQYYKMNEDNTEEVFAKKFKDDKMEEYYAQTEEKVEFLPKKKSGDTWVSSNYRRDGNLNYIYPYNNLLNKEEYEYEANGDPRLALDRDNKPYYPSQKDSLTDDFIQYIPTRKNGERFYIIDNGKQVYPKNVSQNIFVYPKDEDGNDYYLNDENGENYYIKNGDNESYAYVKFGKFWKNILAIRNNALTYAKVNNGQKEIYPVDNEFQKEYYIRDGNQNPKWALDENNKPYYPSYKMPLTQDWIQYIPITENIPNIITENGKQLYPKNLTKNVFVYPKDDNEDEYYLKNEQNEEYYIENENEKQIYASFKNGINRLVYRNGEPIYAREGKKEIYPSFGPGKTQFYKIINHVERGALLDADQKGYYYAKDEKRDEYYPKDFSVPQDEKSPSIPVSEKTSSESESEDDEETKKKEEDEKTSNEPEGVEEKNEIEEDKKTSNDEGGNENKKIEDVPEAPAPTAIDYSKLNSMSID